MLEGHRLLQVWQYTAQQEQTLDAVLNTASKYGYTGVLIKALDGEIWMGDIELSPDALMSLEQVELQVQQAHTKGLLYCCWTNPLYSPPGILESDLTGQIAKRVDALFLDVEPYSQFWGANRESGLATRFMQQVRSNAPDAYIVLQPDPRSDRFAEIRIQEWLPYIDAISGQHYFNDFQVPYTVEIDRIKAIEALYGKPVIPTLPLNAALSELVEMKLQLNQWVVWRLGSTLDNVALSVLGASSVNVARIRNNVDNLWAYTERMRTGEHMTAAHIIDMQHRLVEIKTSIGLI